MNKILIFLILFLTLNQEAISQNALDQFIETPFNSGCLTDTIVNNQKLKVFSEFQTQFSKLEFYCGKIEIKDGRILGDQQPSNMKIDYCDPCYLYLYRDDGTLWQEGVFLTDCIYGPTVKYFRDGKIALVGNYIPDTSRISGRCSIKHGDFVIYNHYGVKTLSEFWENGKLVRIFPEILKENGDVVFIKNDDLLLINDTIRLEAFRKIQLRPDTNHNIALKDGFFVLMEISQKENVTNFFRFDNLHTFNDKIFISTLKKKGIKIKNAMQMQIDIYKSKENEIIETHFLVFEP